jgi:hypothetical protein
MANFKDLEHINGKIPFISKEIWVFPNLDGILPFIFQAHLDILLGVIILTAGFNAGRIGLDRWVIPYIHKFAGKEKDPINSVKHSA